MPGRYASIRGNFQTPNHNKKETRQLVSRTAAAVANREAIDGRRSWHTLRMGVPIAEIVQSESKALPESPCALPAGQECNASGRADRSDVGP
jgi:hypothetical protein